MTEHVGSEYVEILPDARDFVRRFEAQTGAGLTEAGRKAGNEWQRGFQAAVGNIRIRPDVDTAAARAELAALNRQVTDLNRPGRVNVLRDGLIALSPAIVPVAGAAGLAGAALVAMGVTGALAVKGASAEMKAGTAEGLRFAASVRTIKTDVAGLEATAAHGVLTPFEKAVSRIHADMPALNADLAQSSKVLGDIGGHVAGALIGGEHTFAPALLSAETTVDHIAARFESWATGPGGARFAAALADDFGQVEPVIEDIAGAIAHVVAASDVPGLAIVHELDLFANILDAIPTPVLTALVTGIVGLKVAGLVTGLMDKLALSIRGVAVAEGEAAVASTGFRARTATGIGLVGKFGAGLLVAEIGFSALSDATDKWRTSLDETKNVVGDTFKTASDLFSFHWGSLADDLTGLPDRQNAARAAQLSAQTSITTLGVGPDPLALYNQFTGQSSTPPGYAVNARAAVVDIHDEQAEIARLRATMLATEPTAASLRARMSALSAAGRENSTEFRQLSTALDLVTSGGLAVADQYQVARDKLKGYQTDLRSYRAILAEIDRVSGRYANRQATQLSGLSDNTFKQNPSLTAGVTGLDAYQKTLGKAIKTEESWTKVTDDNTIKIRGNTYETKAWYAAVAAAGGDKAKAAGLLLGHTQALESDTRMAAIAADEQLALSSAIGAAEVKYQLNDQQLNQYAATLGITSKMLADGTVSTSQFVGWVGKVRNVVDQADSSTQGWVAALDQFNSGADTAVTRGQLLAAAMVSLNGSALGYADTGAKAAAANQQFVTDFNAARKSVVNLKTGVIDFHNAGAAPLLDDLQNLQSTASQFAAATYQNEVATRGRTQASKDAAAVYYNDTRQALIAEHDQLNITGGEAKRLADTYFHWPKDAKTQIEALGGDDTSTLLNAIGEQLAILTKHPWIFDVQASLSPNAQKFLDSTGHGIFINPQTGLPQGNNSAGGNLFERHTPQIAHGLRVWAEPETHGEAYLPLADDWRRPRAKGILSEVARRFGGAAYFAGGGGPGETGGFTGVNQGGDGSGKSGGSSSGTSDAQKAANELAAARASARSDLQAFLQAIGITTNAITSAERQLDAALQSAKVSTDELTKISHETHRLVDLAKSITTETDRIGKAQDHLANVQQHQTQVQQAANQEGASVRDAIMSLFDLSQAGVQQQVYRDKPAGPVTGASILSSITSAADTGVATKHELAQLKGHIPDALYRELAGNAGQDQAQIQALAGSSGHELDLIAAQYERLRKAAKGTGASVIEELFGGKLDAAGKNVAIAKGLLNGVDPDKNPELAKAVRRLSDKMFGAGKETAKGLAEGLVAERADLRKSLRQLGRDVADEIRDDLAGRTPTRRRHRHGPNNSSDAQAGPAIIFNGPVNDTDAVARRVEYELAKASRRGRH